MRKSFRQFLKSFPHSAAPSAEAVSWLLILTTAVSLFLFALLPSGSGERLTFSARTLDDRAGLKFPLAPLGSTILGRLQAMNVPPIQDGGLALQWHLLSWPNPWFDRFPLTIDQNMTAKKATSDDEFGYWMGVPSKGSAPKHNSVACPQANPHTPSTFRIWDSAISNPGHHLGELILSDSLVDVEHTDLKEIVSIVPTGAEPALNPDAHGTHVAGILGAVKNGEGVVGVVPGLQTKLFPLPIRNTRSGPRIEGKVVFDSLDAIIASLIAGSSNGTMPPRVVLLSWAFFESDGLSRDFVDGLSYRIRQLLEYDVAIVVPSGNLENGRFESADKVYPAAWAGQFRDLRGSLLPVASSDVCSRVAWFSNLVGNDLGTVLIAPGERIYSTLPRNDYGYMSGTSASAAQVAALLAMTSAQFPDVEMKTQVHTLLRTAMPLSNLEGERIVSFDAPAYVQGLMAEFGWIARY